VDNPSTPQDTLGGYLKRARMRAKLSIRQLEQQAGVPNATIRRLEKDEVQHPSPILLNALATALDLHMADLLDLLGVHVPPTPLKLHEYLKARYPQLPEAALTEAQQRVDDVLHQYGYTNTDET
jgi:transcriptional regulator with XRE-family HTH domain